MTNNNLERLIAAVRRVDEAADSLADDQQRAREALLLVEPTGTEPDVVDEMWERVENAIGNLAILAQTIEDTISRLSAVEDVLDRIEVDNA